MSLRGRRVILVAVGGAAILLAAVILARDDAPAAQGSAAARGAARRSRAGEVTLNDVKLKRLQRTPGTLEEPGRNPFRFEARSTPAAPPPKGGAAAPPRTPTSVVPQIRPPAGPQGPPPIPLKFIGLVEAPSQAGRVAILSDGRGNVFYGREGDAIEGQYRMLKISPEVIELSYMDGRGRQTIRLSGQ